MMDSSPDDSHDRRSVDQEAFAKFLDALSADTDEAGRMYTRVHQKLVGFFSMKGVADPVNAADETIDRAAIKIARGVPVPAVDKYCLGIARNIAKERLRLMQRENSAFLGFIGSLPDSSSEHLERIYNILKPCFDKLAAEEQKLLLSYCQILRGRERAEHRRQLAEAMQTTVLALRMRVTRLRSLLFDCVQKQTAAAA
jgi:hypothetical protein